MQTEPADFVLIFVVDDSLLFGQSILVNLVANFSGKCQEMSCHLIGFIDRVILVGSDDGVVQTL